MRKSILFIFSMMFLMGMSTAFAQDDPFADLGDGGDLAAPDGSSALRGLKVKKSPEDFEAKVIRVIKTGQFPICAVEVEVTVPPKSKAAPHKDIKKKAKMVLLPKYDLKNVKGKMKPGKMVYTDPAKPNPDVKPLHPQFDFNLELNQASVGAWFLQKKDKVRAKLTGKKKGSMFYVEFLERK